MDLSNIISFFECAIEENLYIFVDTMESLKKSKILALGTPSKLTTRSKYRISKMTGPNSTYSLGCQSQTSATSYLNMLRTSSRPKENLLESSVNKW